jgi:hypothetical protein
MKNASVLEEIWLVYDADSLIMWKPFFVLFGTIALYVEFGSILTRVAGF